MRPWRTLFSVSAWPIAAKLSLALVLLAVTPLVCTAYFNLRQSMATLEETEYRNLELLAVSTASRLDQLIADTQRVVIQAAGDHEVVDFLAHSQDPDRAVGVRGSVQQTLDNILRSNPNYEDIFLLDRSGTCPISTEPKMLGANYAFRPYYRAAIAGHPYISEILVGTVTGTPGMFFASPVMPPPGAGTAPVGVAVIKMRGQTLSAIIDAVKVGQGGYAYLVDQDGVVISHPDPAFRYHSLAPLQKETLSRIVAERRFGEDHIESLGLPDLAAILVHTSEPGHARYVLPSLQRDPAAANSGAIDGAPRAGGQAVAKIAGFAPLIQRAWVVAVSEPQEQFIAPLRVLGHQIELIVLFMSAVAMLIAVLLGNGIARPIRALTRAAAAVAKGEFDAGHVEVRSTDEIGVLAATFNRMAQGLRERQRERDIFGRVLSPEVREKLLSGNLELGGETRRVSVLLSDIRDFSTIAESKSPQDVVKLLNEYLAEITVAVRPWGGYVNNFIGDAIVVVFGAPLDRSDAEWSAVAAAMTMRERLKALNERRVARGEEPLRSGIGIATGEAVAGQIGSRERLQYTVIGDVVNVAARLEALTKDYPGYDVLVNESTILPLLDRLELTIKHVGLVKLKGRLEPVDVYAVTDWRRPASSISSSGSGSSSSGIRDSRSLPAVHVAVPH